MNYESLKGGTHLYQHTITLSLRNNAGTWYVSYQFIDTHPDKYTYDNHPTHLCAASGRSSSSDFVCRAEGINVYADDGSERVMTTYSDTVKQIL